jgi:hypothetical protein
MGNIEKGKYYTEVGNVEKIVFALSITRSYSDTDTAREGNTNEGRHFRLVRVN